ncbi:MAG: hypothetical protein Q8K46_07345, partial [Deltaproteobacteria bacterium]|nr:hypothetical protein [Deltaproteobacteria bacterium]
MLRRGRFIRLVSPLILFILIVVLITGKFVVAAGNVALKGVEAVVADKVSPLDRSALPVEKQDAVKKPQI